MPLKSMTHDTLGGHGIDHGTSGTDPITASSISAAPTTHSHVMRFGAGVPTGAPADYENGLAFDTRPNDGGLYGWNSNTLVWVRLTVPLSTSTGESSWAWAHAAAGKASASGSGASSWTWSETADGKASASGGGASAFLWATVAAGNTPRSGRSAVHFHWTTQVPA